MKFVITVISFRQGLEIQKTHKRGLAETCLQAALLPRLTHKVTSLQPRKKVLLEKISLSFSLERNPGEQQWVYKFSMKVCWMQTRYFSPIFWSLICHGTNRLPIHIALPVSRTKLPENDTLAKDTKWRRFGVKRSRQLILSNGFRAIFFRNFCDAD